MEGLRRRCGIHPRPGRPDLERVEGKQHVYGSLTTTDWEIDGKGLKVGDEGFIIIECRRYPKVKQNQEQDGGLAFRISDTGASGGIYVSPLASRGRGRWLPTPVSTRSN